MKILRSILLFALMAITGSALYAGPALAITSMTQSQVNNVCGPDLKTENGHSGCTKKCANGTSTCIYDCSQKTGECNGVSIGLVSGTPPAGPKWPNSLLTHPTEVQAQSQGGGHGPKIPTGTGPTIPVDKDPPVFY